MDPRLTKSKRWTSFPEEFLKQIEGVIAQNFKDQSKNGKFVVRGHIYSSEILLRIGYLENGRLVQANADVSIEYNFKKENTKDLINLAVDTAGSLIDTYFTSPDEDFPRDWKKYKVEKKDVYLKFCTDNDGLESDADALLKEAGDADLTDENENLVHGDDADEDVKSIIKALKDE